MTPTMDAKGPKQWDMLELQASGALNVEGMINLPNLSSRQPLLKIFEVDRWQVDPEEYALLLPSIRLASNIVRVGMPYIASFLPSDKLFLDGDLEDEDGNRQNLCPDNIELNENPSKEEVEAAFNGLQSLAPFITWQTNYEMYGGGEYGGEAPLRWLSTTRLVNEDRPWDITRDDDVVAEDYKSRERGLKHRPLIIAIMGEYVNTIREGPIPSEQHLRAVFMAGITMAHEVGHAIFHQDFRSFNPPYLLEPYVGIDCASELGLSFISWVYSGYHPQCTDLDNKLASIDFRMPLFWDQCYTMRLGRRPLYKTLYSISMHYVQGMLMQAWWDRLPSYEKLIDFSVEARNKLKPNTNLDSGKTTTSRRPEWSISMITGHPEWKQNFGFRLPGFRYGNTVYGLSEEEIEWEKARDLEARNLSVYKNMSASQLQERPRTIRSLQGLPVEQNQGDDSEPVLRDDGDFMGRRQGDLPRVPGFYHGMLEKDVIPSLEDDTTPVTCIKVSYLPDQEIPAERPRKDDDGNQEGRSEKRRRYEPRNDYIRRRGRSTSFNPTSVDALLEQNSPFALSTKLTRIEAHDLCIKRKMKSWNFIPPHESWQQSKLDIGDPQDMYVIQRIFNDMLETLEEKDFTRDPQAIMKLRKASVASIRHWDHSDLIAFALGRGLDAEGSRDSLIRRVREWKQKEIDVVRSGMSSPDESELGEDVSMEDRSNPKNWSLDELQLFCQQNDLSEVGTRNTLVVKVQKYMKEQAQRGKSSIRRTQRERTDIYGQEWYTFRAILGQSSVAALKRALFVAGDFPPETVMTLFFKDTRQEYLQDNKPLNFYKHKDWTMLQLRTTAKGKQAWPGSAKLNALHVGAEAKLKSDNSTQRAEALKAILSDPSVQRAADILLNGARPTLSELAEQVGDRAKKLDQMVQARSGLEILGEVEDYEDDEENKKRGLEKLVRGELEGGGRGEDDYPPPGCSHMEDLFYAIGKKRGL